ncbi:pyridoxal phosphatase [Spirabiliibacterium falconis]|uniref:pyridoxal phosphatase n=1 Tax=Spirabiliibacterium falconis TaxID=572023 RepID=UPI001AAE0CAF|nr:pyridoxal phosphatase [Spirabiliibacterium falconis]MBE2894970.1 pyridoxal phosphatase [Spirabiliibacterium falconis]
MDYRVVAFDLDGTLLNSQGHILPENLRAIAKVRSLGIKVVLVTGRHHTAARFYHAQLGLDTPIICCNGTYLYDYQQEKVLSANPLTWAQCRRIIALNEQFGIHLLMYTRDEMAFCEINSHMAKFKQWATSCPVNERPQLRQLTSFYEPLAGGETIWKFVLSDPDTTLMQKVVNTLPEDQFSCEWSWFDRVDIASYGNTKGRRLLSLLASWHISPHQVIAFGDNHNDLSMLSQVGLGVAMGNAESAVKTHATCTIGDNNQPSIAQFLGKQFDFVVS